MINIIFDFVSKKLTLLNLMLKKLIKNPDVSLVYYYTSYFYVQWKIFVGYILKEDRMLTC